MRKKVGGSVVTASNSCLIELTKNTRGYFTTGKFIRGPDKRSLILQVCDNVMSESKLSKPRRMHVRSVMFCFLFQEHVDVEEMGPELPMLVTTGPCSGHESDPESGHEVDTTWSSDSTSASGMACIIYQTFGCFHVFLCGRVTSLGFFTLIR